MRFPNNLRALQKAKGWTIDQAADAMGMSRGGYIKIERGENRLTSTTIEKAASVFEVSQAKIIPPSKAIQVIGLVGAGSQTIIYSDGDPHDDWVQAPAYATEKTVALEIRGTSLGTHFDGWLLFYDDVRSPVTDDLIGRLCVVCLDNGTVLAKEVRRGQLPNKFNLLSIDPPIYDVMIVWAALVKGMEPR